MRPRWLALILSIALFIFACVLPALASPKTAPGQPSLIGLECLFYGPVAFMFVWPVVCWLPNPMLLLLWINIFRRAKTRSWVVWGALGLAVVGVALLPAGHLFLRTFEPRVGAIFWVASIAIGGYAAKLTDDDVIESEAQARPPKRKAPETP
jgi:hypothetical protein